MAGAAQSPSVSVVMPTHNRAYALEAALSPLLADPATLEVVVVVDGSPDGSLELLHDLARGAPRVRPLFIEKSGEMGARAAGVEAARGDVVLFVDDDVLAEPGLVSAHARRHAGGERLVVLGYMPVALRERRSRGEFATRLYAREYEGSCAVYEEQPGSVLRTLWGGNFSLRRADCAAIGLKNPAYTERYHPDQEFGIRCLKAGLTGVFDRSLRASHLHERSLEAFAEDVRSQGAARVLLHRLHPDVVDPVGPAAFEEGLPSPARSALRAARRPHVHAAATAALRGLVRAGGALHAWPVEDAAAKLLRRLEWQRGAAEAATGRRSSG